MTQLRQKMIRAMELKNLSSHTQRAYLATVTGIARYYQKSPDKLIKEMVEDGKGGKDRYTLLSGYLPAYFLIFSKTPCHNSLISVTPSMYPADKRMTTNTRAVNIEIARLPPSVVESNPDRTVPLKNSRNSPKGILNRNVRR